MVKDRASLFQNGGSQAVRLPKAYRFEGTHVIVRREGSAVILEPMEPATWPEGHWERLAVLGPVTDDFQRPEPLPEAPHRDRALTGLDERDRG